MNEIGPCARYIDCETGRRERNEVLDAFKRGDLAFVVNVRVLAQNDPRFAQALRARGGGYVSVLRVDREDADEDEDTDTSASAADVRCDGRRRGLFGSTK